MPRFTGWLRPVVDAAARVNSGVHRKLLFGFLAGALLLVAMGALGLVVIRQMNDRMVELNRAQLKATRAHEMLYAVTAQSHYRAMALLLPQDAAKYNGQVEDAKTTFAALLDAIGARRTGERGVLRRGDERQPGVRGVEPAGVGAVPAGRHPGRHVPAPQRGASDVARARGVDEGPDRDRQ